MAGYDQKADFVFDGEFLVYKIKISEDAQDGVYPIQIYKDDVSNYDGKTLKIVSNPGYICINSDEPTPSHHTDGDLVLNGSVVSGKPGDEALSLDNDRAFWFNTRSSASWAKNFNVTNETQMFYPMKDGTVEAWFRPAARQAGATVRLFDAASQHTKVGHLPFAYRDVCSLMALDWRPKDGTLALTMRPRKWAAGRAGRSTPIAQCRRPARRRSSPGSGTTSP